MQLLPIVETIASMYALVNELETIMDQFVSKQDELILSTCGQELEAIGSMECEQGQASGIFPISNCS